MRTEHVVGANIVRIEYNFSLNYNNIVNSCKLALE